MQKDGEGKELFHSELTQVKLGSLSFTFPGTANGRFELSWQNFR
jgi:hypothetical protein